jgi:hypothetical protein
MTKAYLGSFLYSWHPALSVNFGMLLLLVVVSSNAHNGL